jgi:peptidylprolyl isomerase
VAQRGNTKLTVGDVREQLDRLDPAQRTQLQANPQALAAAVRERVLQLTLLAEAKSKNWDTRPEVIARINDARDGVIVQTYLASLTQVDPAYPSEADLAAAYEANKARFLLPRMFRLAQIAILVPQGAPKEADDEAKRRAQDARAQLGKPRADFADIARKVSQDRVSAERGGELGWVREDQILPVIAGAVTIMQEGAISDPVRSPTGWHIVKLEGIRPAGPATLAEVHDQLVTAMRQQRQQQQARAYLEDMQRRDPIQLNEIDLTHAVAAH